MSGGKLCGDDDGGGEVLHPKPVGLLFSSFYFSSSPVLLLLIETLLLLFLNSFLSKSARRARVSANLFFFVSFDSPELASSLCFVFS